MQTPTPQRILIIGSGGAGKSTLAGQLHALTGIEVIHLDQHYWQPDWVETEKREWEEKVAALAARDSWIMDGNYGGTLDLRIERADTVIFLDRSRWRCLYRVMKRLAISYGRTRADMAAGCRERFDWAFVTYVYGYTRTRRPAILSKLEGIHPQKTVVRLRSDREVSTYLAAVKNAILAIGPGGGAPNRKTELE
ncbi:adenylate kinase family enzyme [Neolewinella xylanilytica]|uniref:Adenylate kinase family enzyme n=1 Tax=Neolewinella xylanilytica TaxID=1514080 RepID=A0A2S6IAJ3_9BACT|nr:hypothetical protein [Neolewinella xylanilytica]PPK88506.1 adenylate kinase family enzyme [Neolewinella xylanilytica]